MGFMDKVKGLKNYADDSQVDDQAMAELKRMRNRRKNQSNDQD